MLTRHISTDAHTARGVFNLGIGIAGAILVTACGGGGSNTTPTVVQPEPPAPVAGLWVNGGEGDGLQRYAQGLSQQQSLTGSVDAPLAVGDAAAPEGAVGNSFSTTYTLEADVDEHDIVKYDGKVLAVANSRSGCCFAVEPFNDMAMVADLPPPNDDKVALYQTDPSSGSASLLANIELTEGEAVEGLYLTGEHLQVLMSSAWWGSYGDALMVPSNFQSQTVRLVGFDISDPTLPSSSNELMIDGALIASRRTGDTIHLITRHAPSIDGLVPYPVSEADVASNEAVLASIDPAELLPTITRNGTPEIPVNLDDCYRTNPEHPLAAPIPTDSSLTLLLSISASTGTIEAAACTLEPVSGFYTSTDHVALTYVDYSTDQQRTWVHLLTLDGFEYLGSEVVDGYLYSGGNTDFRISEFQGVLRLVTTRFIDDPNDRFQHLLHTLAPETNAPELSLLATLGSTAEDALGKPNEDLYGVRFLGTRAYLVTFERIDPLYVVDLTDPESPTILGSLEVPGLSDLLHPVSEDLLLGVGRTNTGYSKVELFNIAEPSQPISVGNFVLGADRSFSYSPAQYNRYAFTYLAGNGTDRFTLPFSTGGNTPEGYRQEAYIGLFEITDKSNAANALLRSAGAVLLTGAQSVSDDTRVVLDQDAIYVLNEGTLWGGLWTQPDGVTPQPVTTD